MTLVTKFKSNTKNKKEEIRVSKRRKILSKKKREKKEEEICSIKHFTCDRNTWTKKKWTLDKKEKIDGHHKNRERNQKLMYKYL